MTGEMFGGLRHRNMKAKGRAIGWIQITASRDYPVEGAQCTCAAVNRVREIMKFITTNTLTGPAYLEMLKKESEEDIQAIFRHFTNQLSTTYDRLFVRFLLENSFSTTTQFFANNRPNM